MNCTLNLERLCTEPCTNKNALTGQKERKWRCRSKSKASVLWFRELLVEQPIYNILNCCSWQGAVTVGAQNKMRSQYLDRLSFLLFREEQHFISTKNPCAAPSRMQICRSQFLTNFPNSPLPFPWQMGDFNRSPIQVSDVITSHTRPARCKPHV